MNGIHVGESLWVWPGGARLRAQSLERVRELRLRLRQKELLYRETLYLCVEVRSYLYVCRPVPLSSSASLRIFGRSTMKSCLQLPRAVHALR